jgi:hypothetical protein
MSTINEFNSSRWSLTLSNIPTTKSEVGKINPSVFENFVKTCTLPDYNLDIQESNFKNTIRKYPNSRYNNELSQITLEFFVDEDLDNYYAMRTWITELRKYNSMKNEDSLVDSSIKTIILTLKDNENRPRKYIKFHDCFLINLSALTLNYGSDSNVTFTCTFVYNDNTVEKADILTNN